MSQVHSYEYPIEDQSESLTLSDKLAGVFTEPNALFLKISDQKSSSANWLIPIITLIVISVLSNYLLMSNPIIKDQVIGKQMAVIEENFEKAVESGQITQAVADQQLAQFRASLEEQIDSGILINAAVVVIITFLLFFIVAGVFYGISKILFNGQGSYSTALTAYGLPYYILILQVLAILIYALATDTFLTGINLAVFMDADKKDFPGFLLSKIDPFSIWFYFVVGIGLARMFKSTTVWKYITGVFSLWFGFSLIFFFVAKEVPLLQMMI
ncbi:hypothetical protein ACFLS9_05610 [Bacteroidota bacterium]